MLQSLSKLTASAPLMFIAVCVMISLYVPTCLQSLATWETENKIYCKQTLVDGDGPKTYWSRELQGDELILVRMERQLDTVLISKVGLQSCTVLKLQQRTLINSHQTSHTKSVREQSQSLQLFIHMKSDRISLAHLNSYKSFKCLGTWLKYSKCKSLLSFTVLSHLQSVTQFAKEFCGSFFLSALICNGCHTIMEFQRR